MSAATASVYSALADAWDVCASVPALQRLAGRVVRELRAGGDVLDVGSGTGALLKSVRTEARRTGKRVGRTVGIDAAWGMAVRTRGRRGVRAAAADAMQLPFPDQVFDVVVCTHVLHLVDDPAACVREMVRVLRPGGTLVTVVRGPGFRTRRLGVVPPALPRHSLLRQYLELPRRADRATALRELEKLGCEVTEHRGPAPIRDRAALLRRAAKTAADRAAVRALVDEPSVGFRMIVARVPGPRRGHMPVRVVDLPISETRVRRALKGLPEAWGYEVVVKPLRYRKRPHVQAFCEFDARRITVQVPVPFKPFAEFIPYRAVRIPGKGLHFRWYGRRLRFERPDELIRYLYLHEYYHWYLREVLDQKSGAETACDRFALERL